VAGAREDAGVMARATARIQNARVSAQPPQKLIQFRLRGMVEPFIGKLSGAASLQRGSISISEARPRLVK
jgi:hypothetical protein